MKRSTLRRKAPIRRTSDKQKERNETLLAWRRLLARARARCEKCGDAPWTPPGEECLLDLHHKIRRSRQGTDRPYNLAALCRQCHDWVHEHPAAAGKEGWLL